MKSLDTILTADETGQNFFVSGGTMPPGAASYVERGADKTLLEALLAGRFCYVLNPRQSGKSSLCVHAMSRLQEQGIRTAFLDLTRQGGANASPEQWYSGIALDLARELDIRREVATYWKEHPSVAPVRRLFDMILEVVLRDDTPLVVFIDEIDATRGLPFDADEFFAAIREVYNRRTAEPKLERLTFCLLGVAVPSDLIRDPAITPFNIGERITLEDFTLKELSAFAGHLGPNGEQIVARIHHWTGGHPYLTQTLCRTIVAEEGASVDAIVNRDLFELKARDSNVNLADVANIALHYGTRGQDRLEVRADVLSEYGRVLSGRAVKDDESNAAVVVLKLSGIVRSERGRLRVRNRIYEHVFNRKWIEERMPDQELRRQRQSFRRGVFRTSLVSGLIVVAVACLAAIAWIARLQALDAQAKLAYELYVADMNGMPLSFENGDTRHIEAVLRRYRNSPLKGFEWGYWLGQYHDAPEEYTLDYTARGKRSEGHISTNGRQICVIDRLTDTATIVDRSTKKVLFAKKLHESSRVVPLRSRWAEIRPTGAYRFEVLDLLTNRTLLRWDGSQLVKQLLVVDHSDLIGVGLESDGATISHRFVLQDAETGEVVFAMPDPWQYEPSAPWKDPLMNFSGDGRYFLYGRGPFGKGAVRPDDMLAGEAVVVDLASKSVVDRFPINIFTKIGSNGIEGDHIFLVEQGHGYLRDFRRHRTIPWAPGSLNDSPVVAATLSGTTEAVLLNGGRCLVRDLSRDDPGFIRGNIFSVAPGSKAGQYLASSSSVRIYDENTPPNPAIAAAGGRVTHFSSGVLNVFGAPGVGIARVDESSFRRLGAVPPLDGAAGTYSGRWFLSKDERSRLDVLNDATGAYRPVRLPFAPANWSGGQDDRSIALWRVGQFEIDGFAVRERRVRWTRKGIKNVDGMWVSPDGARLLYAIGRESLHALDMADGHELGVLETPISGRMFVTFSVDGSRMFTCTADGRVVMWDPRRLSKIAEFRGNDLVGMTSADISPDGRRVVTSDDSGSWQLWDEATGTMLMSVKGSPSSLSSGVFSSDGQHIVTAGDDGKVRGWRAVRADPTIYLRVDPKLVRNLPH